MKKLLRRVLCCLSLSGVLIAVLGTTISVRADDGAPTSPETPVPVVTEEPIATESPAQEPVVPEPGLPAADAPMEELPAQDEAPAQGILASIPEETDVLVLNESGSPEPLATEAAVNTLLTGDPMWCPEGVAPVASAGGCTASHTSFESLLLYLSANEPGQAGVIWIAKDYDSGIHDATITSFTLDGFVNFPTMRDFALTLQGGWNGDSAGTINQTDPSEFNATLNIVNWNGNVSLSDIMFTETNGPGMNLSPTGFVPSPLGASLAVTTTGNVNLNSIDSTSNNSSGVLIDNRSGSGTVSINNSNFSGNGTGINGGLGIYVLSKGPITLNNLIANDNRWEGGKFFNDTAAGSQGDVTLQGTNIFNNNGMDGLMISSLGNINLNNVNVNENGLTGAYLYNADATGNVTFTGTNTFNNNVGTGMYVYSDGVITIHNVTATGNGMEGAVLLNGLYSPSNKIVFTGTNIFQGNSGLNPDGYPDLHIGLENDFAQYTNVTTHGHITLQSLQIDQLPENLPEGTSFVAALQVLEIGEEVVISFRIPDGMQDAEFRILYWDGSQWLDLETAVFEDGRLVKDSGHKTENGYFQATVNFGGVFVLVQK